MASGGMGAVIMALYCLHSAVSGLGLGSLYDAQPETATQNIAVLTEKMFIQGPFTKEVSGGQCAVNGR